MCHHVKVSALADGAEVIVWTPVANFTNIIRAAFALILYPQKIAKPNYN
jgi:hypothetical protein